MSQREEQMFLHLIIISDHPGMKCYSGVLSLQRITILFYYCTEHWHINYHNNDGLSDLRVVSLLQDGFEQQGVFGETLMRLHQHVAQLQAIALFVFLGPLHRDRQKTQRLAIRVNVLLHSANLGSSHVKRRTRVDRQGMQNNPLRLPSLMSVVFLSVPSHVLGCISTAFLKSF